MNTPSLLKVTVLAAIALALPFAASAEPLAVGADSPDLEVKTHLDEDLDLGEALGEGVSLVYFYPKAMTGGCTKQACNLRDFRDELTEAGIKVFGVSVDTVEDQNKFVEKEDLNFTLIADKDQRVSKAFGVLNERGLANRQSFLIEDGKVIWHQPKAVPTTQAEDALAALAEHKSKASS